MRVMVLITGAGADEDKITPTQEMLAQMGAYNEELVKAGVMLDGQGLQPSAKGARVVFDASGTSVLDGPFTESKELLAGYWIWQVSSLEEAVEWARKCPTDPQLGATQVLEIRPIFEVEDFGAEYTPELREKDERLAEQIKAQHG
ncbi:YciI family protein [Cellulosimicrobium cellulans]|uniref:YciI family protein n=1 Tax=Cellulosimicrobium cellulans TaxID=1710 RepID=UPI0008495E21|nr:YciI family protein [Cellulosimicrobium cellulans]